ncbi:MAG: hypothetical protein ACK53I_17590 [Phenylobacterium sp.]|jgi:hypothetical protein
MSRKTYASALEAVLAPMGFIRRVKDYAPHEPQWFRMIGDIQESVGLQRSMDLGTTCNLWTRDTALTALHQAAIPWDPQAGTWSVACRIGALMGDGMTDHWWKNDPSGPDEVAAAVREHAEGYFARYRTPEDQARNMYGRYTEGRRNPGTAVALALTLYRLGELDEALRVLEPRAKLTPPDWVRRMDSVQAWLQARRDEVG